MYRDEQRTPNIVEEKGDEEEARWMEWGRPEDRGAAQDARAGTCAAADQGGACNMQGRSAVNSYQR